jgi:hypothetical protein
MPGVYLRNHDRRVLLIPRPRQRLIRKIDRALRMICDLKVTGDSIKLKKTEILVRELAEEVMKQPLMVDEECQTGDELLRTI